MLRSIAVLSLFMFSFKLGWAQILNSTGDHRAIVPAQTIPLNPRVRTGKLNNGFRYFIMKNTEPKNRVTIYLVNKIGSILENNSQQGLAHFMEHMNFNGTTHFPKNKLVDYLQKSGVRFGADLNAYTIFDETVYQLPIPSDDSALLQNGMLIMRDWAKGAVLDSAEINAERGVVLEEERLGKGASERMNRKILPILLNGSRYAKRLPIGKDFILTRFPAKTLRQFYETWYRPDLQALIVVGDINTRSIARMIKRLFSDLKNPDAEKARPRYPIPLNGKSQYCVVTDPEMTYTDIQFTYKHRTQTLKTKADYRLSIDHFLFNHILNERMHEMKLKPDLPFQDATININGILGDVDALNMEVIPKKGETESGFKSIAREMRRLLLYGFLPGELEAAKTSYRKSMERSLKEKDKNPSDFLVAELVAYFLTGTAAPGIQAEYQMTQSILPQITSDEVGGLAKTYTQAGNLDIIIQAPETDVAKIPSRETLNHWMQEINSETIKSNLDHRNVTALMETKPAPGKIVIENLIPSIGVTEWILSNGLRVLVKPTNFSNDQTMFYGIAPGGLASAQDSNSYLTASFAASAGSGGGVADLDNLELKRYLSEKQSFVATEINRQVDEVKAFTNRNNVKTALELTHLYFTYPRKDTAIFVSNLAHLRQNLINKGNSPEEIFSDSVNTVLHPGDFRYSPMTLERLEKVNFERCFEAYRNHFQDASRFTFAFIGNMDTTILKPLVEEYLGSLPSTRKLRDSVFDRSVAPTKGKLVKRVYAGSEEKSRVQLIYTGQYEATDETNLAMNALSEVLTIRLLETLREKESGAYSPSASVYLSKFEKRFQLDISFGCAPENAERLIRSALLEVEHLLAGGPSEINLAKFKAERRRQKEVQLKSDGFWMGYLQQQLENDDDLLSLNGAEERLKKLGIKDVQKVATKYLKEENLLELILMPKRYSGQTK